MATTRPKGLQVALSAMLAAGVVACGNQTPTGQADLSVSHEEGPGVSSSPTPAQERVTDSKRVPKNITPLEEQNIGSTRVLIESKVLPRYADVYAGVRWDPKSKRLIVRVVRSEQAREMMRYVTAFTRHAADVTAVGFAYVPRSAKELARVRAAVDKRDWAGQLRNDLVIIRTDFDRGVVWVGAGSHVREISALARQRFGSLVLVEPAEKPVLQ